MTRPPSQPDFERSPLNEFVLGIQFAQPHGYQQIYAGEVWSLFRDRFPHVEEHPALTPEFETFGIPQGLQINLGMVSGAAHDRFWFLSPNRQQIIQFQHDRLLHNWREVEGQTEKYPRFEALIETFREEIIALDTYIRKFDSKGLQINQAEVSYINHIKPLEGQEVRPEDWLNFVRFQNIEKTDFQAAFRQTISHPDGRALGRLYCEARTAFEPNGRRFVSLTLAARGAPAEPGIQGALEFLAQGREKLGKLFLAVTTDSAQRAWGRV